MKKGAYIILAITLGLWAGCNGKKQRDQRKVEPAAVAPEPVDPATTFLYSGFPPLEAWMEERYQVSYENMPLEQVFDEEPINGIRYLTFNLPENPPLLNLQSPSISRREILEEIARYWGLDMHVEIVDKKPSHVVVRGRGAASGRAPGERRNELSPPVRRERHDTPTYPAPPPPTTQEL